jgi:hypothetical protein
MPGIGNRIRRGLRSLQAKRAERKDTRVERQVRRAEAKAVGRSHRTFDEGSRGPGGGEGV